LSKGFFLGAEKNGERERQKGGGSTQQEYKHFVWEPQEKLLLRPGEILLEKTGGVTHHLAGERVNQGAKGMF